MTRQEVLSWLIIILLVGNLGLQVGRTITDHQPFVQHCEWQVPGSTLVCHR